MNKKLDEIINSQIKEYQKRKARLFFEMAVGELLETHEYEEVKDVVKSYLEMLDELK